MFQHVGQHNFAIVTDSPWDMSKYLKKQCEVQTLAVPISSKRKINVGVKYFIFVVCYIFLFYSTRASIIPIIAAIG